MFYRSIINQLREWREKSNRKPLVFRGARQVGKTTTIVDFGREFEHFIMLNLERKDDASVFANYNTAQEVVDYLFLKHRIRKSTEQSVLLFIDEIQEEPKAIAMLRYFYEDVPWLFVVAAGSRLQSLVKKHISFPVGRVEYLTLRPFSFLEYVEASEGKEWADLIRNRRVDSMLHGELIRLFNHYALVGGMPEVVAADIKHNDIQRLSPIYKSLLNGYSEDVERYANTDGQAKVLQHLLKTGWAFAGEAISFAGFGNSSYTSTQIHEAFALLEKAFVLSLDYPVTSQEAPAIPSLRRSPKLVWVDSGIVNFMADIQIEYLQNKELLDTWRGRAAEQIVAQELRVVLDRNYRDDQYFWVRDKKGTSAEIDYVWQYGTNIVPIEVKTGTNSHLRSLHSFVNLSERKVMAVRVWSGEYSVEQVKTPAPESNEYTLVNLPFYYLCVFDEIIKDVMRGI